MTRYERNMLRKRRRRFMIFSLIFVLIIFFMGIYSINKVMVETTNLPKNKNIFTVYYLEKYFVKLIGSIKIKNYAIMIGNILDKLYMYIQTWIKDLYSCFM